MPWPPLRSTDAVIVNTCAVTAEAERQARQAIRRARRERPGAQVIVTGCAAQIDPERFAAMAEVDRVLGNREKLETRSYDESARVAVGDLAALGGGAAPLGRRVRGPRARLRRGAARLRPSLHFLHHPVRARGQPVGAGGRGRAPGASALSPRAMPNWC